MASLNDILTIGRSGVLTHQERLAVIGHNIANINTPGYHRQKAVLGTNPPNRPNLYTTRGYDIGTGVRVVDIVRSFNQAKEDLYWDINSSLAANTALADNLPDIERILNSGISDTSINENLAKFWAAWQDVAVNPTNLAMRNVLLERAATLTNSLNTTDIGLAGYTDAILAGAGPYTGLAADVVDNINEMAGEIQELNVRITRSEAMGSSAADLMDRRTALIRDLSAQVGITVDPDMTIRVDGQILVSGDGATRNDLAITSSNPPAFTVGGNAVAISGGKLDGMLMTISVVGTLRGKLDSLAQELITEVNTLHTAGYDLAGNAGVEFFTGTGAGDIALNSVLYDYSNPLLNAPELIAAAATLHDPGPPPIPNTGDGAKALEIADLATTKITALTGRTFSTFFTDLASAIGARIESANNAAASGETQLDMCENAIQQEDGVSLDEELVEMMAAQRAFAASSKVVTMADEMMDIIINRLIR